MAYTNFTGPVRSDEGFEQLVNGVWTPVSGGGGGTTFVSLSSENKYTDNYYEDPPTGPGAGTIVELPVIGVGETYTIYTGGSAGGLEAWALQLPSIPGIDIAIYFGDYNVKAIGGDYPVYTVLNEYSTGPDGATDTVYIYGFINNPMQILRLEDLVVPGFGAAALFQQVVPPGMNITPYPNPFVYPFTNLISP